MRSLGDDRRRQLPHARPPRQTQRAPTRSQRRLTPLAAGTIYAISFDVIVQPFHDGDAATVDGARVLEALNQFATEPVTPSSSWIRTTDGEAQIFGLDEADSGFMINHASGEVIWDALVHVADLNGLTILPIDCPTCVTRDELLRHLPEELRDDTRIVTTGAQLIAAFN